MTEVTNNQRKIKLDLRIFRLFAASLQQKVEEAKGKLFTVAFVSDRKMRQLNKTFRGKNATTDVLAFPANDYFLGEIVISTEQALRQAKANNLPFEIEVKQLILHGLLHLCGYDHETDNGEMNQRELELRKMLGI